MVNFSFSLANHSAVLHKIQWKDLIKEYICTVWMHVSGCMYGKMRALLSFWVRFALLSACFVPAIFWKCCLLFRGNLRSICCDWASERTLSGEKTENERSVERDTSPAGATAGPWSWIPLTSKPVSALPPAIMSSKESSSRGRRLYGSMAIEGGLDSPGRWLLSSQQVPILFHKATRTKNPEVLDVPL